MKYFKFGVQGRGTSFNEFGLVQAEDAAEASEKINRWAAGQPKEHLRSLMPPQDRDDPDVEPAVCLQYSCCNNIQVFIP